MTKLSLIIFCISIISIVGILKLRAMGQKPSPTLQKKHSQAIYDYSLISIDGDPFPLNQLKGTTVLIVNVASKCGFTPQYKGLQKIYDTYKDQNFTIIGIPSNDFGNQEPGDEDSIKSFCDLNYKVMFPLMKKIHVKGKKADPFYQYLTDKSSSPFPGSIKWNFTKFLINKHGQITHRFSPMTKPRSKKVIRAIEDTLNQK